MERCEVAPEADHARALRWASYCGVAGPPKLRDRFKEDLEGLLASLPREIEDAISKVSAKVRVYTAPPRYSLILMWPAQVKLNLG